MTPLNYTIIDAPDSSLNKTSVLVTGESEALLVDAGFTRADGHRIVARILDSGKSLQTVLITAGDPDFYFGAEVIAEAFPEARFLAPDDVIEHIKDTYEKKLVSWAHLGANLPSRLITIAPLTETRLTVDGVNLEVRRASKNLGDRAWFVYEPVDGVLLGGVLLFEGLHVWTADSPTREQREEWIRVLDSFEALNPSFVSAGHRTTGSPTDLTSIQHTRDYLRFFETTVADAPDAAAAETTLKAAYPDAGLGIAATLGTKVAKGEMTWG
ncbi:MBL fold metallo-hydrolase [Arthrobacter sp. 24S4-2]|uniref:MBL fold metallo-hydrolase n=1 Tax=Arthrobacter sp. 24S4-2 TaxID=2575374 RepID=UPI0010C7A63C|nr:MBL fold metallo-hydrolase [Arthrobacter sp. 24S4-2]QCO98307.1 MBL fold metallo-hydrolase [Arthrobacter sp. 24S4-2]